MAKRPGKLVAVPTTKSKMSNAEKIQKLKLFNEKVETVKRGRFLSQISEGRGLTLFLRAGNITHEMRSADEDAVLALVTTLRFFVQPGDGITPKQIADIYETLPLDDGAKEAARTCVANIETYLDRPTHMTVFGETLTNRRIFEVIMYGGLAHANNDKRKVYEDWMTGPLAGSVTFEFHDIAKGLVSFLDGFYRMNKLALSLLE